MSTRSELYHCFGLGVVDVSRTDFNAGETVFYCRTPASRLHCACCHGTDVICRGTVTRRFRLVPIGSRRTRLAFELQRLECRDCGAVRQEKLSFAKPYKRYTRTFARYVLGLSHLATIKDVAKHLGVSWYLVAEIQREQLEKDARKVTLSEVRQIAIDELAVGKGHHYVSIVLDLDTGAAIHVAEGKAADSV